MLCFGTLVGVLLATLHLVLANPHVLGDAAALEEGSESDGEFDRERNFADEVGDDGGGIELALRVDHGGVGGGALPYAIATTFVVTEEEAGAGGAGTSDTTVVPGPDDSGGAIRWGSCDEEEDGGDGFGEFAASSPPRALVAPAVATTFLD